MNLFYPRKMDLWRLISITPKLDLQGKHKSKVRPPRETQVIIPKI